MELMEECTNLVTKLVRMYSTNNQESMLVTEEVPKGAGVYVQIPFCPDRCDYCAVPVSVSTALLPRYLEALAMEAGRVAGLFRSVRPVSLYIGGGSPLSLPREHLLRLLEILAPFFPEGAKGEVTIESRPEDLDADTLEILGIHIIGREATEVIHIGQVAMSFNAKIDYFIDQVFNYPTFAEGYRIAALNGWNKIKHKR